MLRIAHDTNHTPCIHAGPYSMYLGFRKVGKKEIEENVYSWSILVAFSLVLKIPNRPFVDLLYFSLFSLIH